MTSTGNKFTFKIILSYLMLGTLAVVVSYFLYTEYQRYNQSTQTGTETDKIIETGSLINLIYEADGYGRLAVLSARKEDFNSYVSMVDSLQIHIDDIKTYVSDAVQLQRLDSVKALLNEKQSTIEQLRVLEITSRRDTSLEDVLEELKFMDNDLGIISAGTLFKNSTRLDSKSYDVLQDLADLYNRNSGLDTTTVPATKVDSLLTQSRYIVREAQRENSRMRNALRKKENELIENDLIISSQLEEIIADFDNEIAQIRSSELEERASSQARTKEFLQIAGIAGTLIVFLFSYLILTDFFKAERLKKGLKEEKAFSDSLLKSREQLISAVSHDLKTPLQTISGYSELLQNDLPKEKQKQFVSRIHSSAGFVTNLVDDLLDFSKLEAGKLVLDEVPFSLDQLLRESGEEHRDRFSEKGVALTLEIDETVASQIYRSDPLRVRQIINNLVGNAFKFTSEGSVTIFAEEIKKKKGKASVRVTVRDTGIGISEEKQQEIFKEFTQADGSVAKKFGGTGLGLAISMRLTKLLQGQLEVESTPGKGSSFILTLPLQHATSNALTPSKTSFKLEKPLSVVVVDDDPSILAMLTDLFTTHGFSCESFQGAEAVPTVNGIVADFILTDIQMPKVSGTDFLSSLKQGSYEWYNSQPVLAMTGNREYKDGWYEEKGFSGIIHKPFSRDQLFSTLQVLFPKHFSEQEVLEETIKSKRNDLYDLSLLRSFLDSDQALQYTLDIFFEETFTNMNVLKEAFRLSDYESIRATSHKMLTMSRQLEARKLTPLLERLEQVHEDNCVTEELQGLWDGLEKEVTGLVDGLRRAVA